MKPFLILQLRPEAPASDDEYRAILAKSGLRPEETRRIRLERESLPDGLDLADHAGVIVGGGPGCVSDPPEAKTPLEARIEAEMLDLMPQITAGDVPFMGCCYGIGLLAAHLGAEVSKARWGEPVGAAVAEKTDAGAADPLLADLPERFTVLVGHKEAVQTLPAGAVHLLRSASCPYQMIRHGRNVYATQFHPEGDADVFALRVEVYRDHGYFPPREADALLARVRALRADHAPRLLRAFVDRCRAAAPDTARPELTAP